MIYKLMFKYKLLYDVFVNVRLTDSEQSLEKLDKKNWSDSNEWEF